MTIEIRTEQAIETARIALLLGDVERATKHPCGKRETDTTHSLMLVWVACELAERENVRRPALLNAGLVAQLAAVHDATEAFAGDTQTLRISPELLAEKEAREDGAAEEIYRRVPGHFLSDLLRIYREQRVREARFVRAVDKALPKLTHLLNGGLAFQDLGMGWPEFLERMRVQDDEIEAYAPDVEFPVLWELRRSLIGSVARMLMAAS